MEQDAREAPSGITRGQNVFYVLPHDWGTTEQFLGPALDRVDADVAELQALVVTPDAESAAAIAASAVRLAGARGVVAVPATSARRAQRQLRERPAHLVIGAPAELLALVQASALKLEQLKVLVLAWADTLLAAGAAEDLETLLAELPRESARVIVAGEASPEVEALVERYARRPRRVLPASAEAPTPVSLDYLSVSATSRASALRRLLDELDPPSAVVVARTPESEAEARAQLRALGYADEGGVRVARTASADAKVALAVLYDFPADAAELQAVAAGAMRVVALAQPRQLGALRAFAGGGRVAPLTLSEASGRARRGEAALHAELRARLAGGAFGRELLALEPLLEEYDGIEIAAAALQLLDEARRAPRAASGARETGKASMVRLYLNIGSRDGARPGDLVGAIANEGGVSSAQVGKVEMRDTHSLVEVDAGAAEEVARKITGALVRGRRLQARVDTGADRPPRRDTAGGDRPRRPREDGGDRPRRGPRDEGGDRPRRFTRGPGGPGGPRGDAGEGRPPRRPGPPRAPRER